MFYRINKACGQSTLEYAVIIAVIVAALLAMQVYVKRGIQGRLRTAADEVGQQYDPGNTTSDITTSLTSDVTTEVVTVSEIDPETGKEVLKTTTTATINNEKETRHGWENVGAFDK